MLSDIVSYTFTGILFVAVVAVAHNRRNIAIGRLGLSVVTFCLSLTIWFVSDPSLMGWIFPHQSRDDLTGWTFHLMTSTIKIAATIGLFFSLWTLVSPIVPVRLYPEDVPLSPAQSRPLMRFLRGEGIAVEGDQESKLTKHRAKRKGSGWVGCLIAAVAIVFFLLVLSSLPYNACACSPAPTLRTDGASQF